ncbi:4'-phosphopantetheinyl transferase superfamily protein [Ruminococcaceae bacterium OttesenSCG-928-I18]|nr:4'-phosphopantetheinyl transferase superfamily protein [Ruminococcaceae bacterium OttesenSCG-928-I18]
MIKLYLVSIGALGPLAQAMLCLLPPGRREKTMRYIKEEDRLRSAAAGLLLRYAFGTAFEEGLTRGDYGKPEAQGKQAPCPQGATGHRRHGGPHPPQGAGHLDPLRGDDIYFNLSHAGEYVVLATASSEVGVDIEPIAPFEREVAKRCFQKNEQAFLWEGEDSERRFAVLWTTKESIMKATGRGFSLPPESFSILDSEGQMGCEVEGQKWYPQTFTWDRHIVTVTTRQKETLVPPTPLTKEELTK